MILSLKWCLGVCPNSECYPLLICRRGTSLLRGESASLSGSHCVSTNHSLATLDNFWPISATLALFGHIWLLLGPAGCCRLECGLVGANVCAAPALSKGGFHPATTQYHTTSDNAGTSTGTSPGTSLASSCSGIPVAHWYPAGHTGTEQWYFTRYPARYLVFQWEGIHFCPPQTVRH